MQSRRLGAKHTWGSTWVRPCRHGVTNRWASCHSQPRHSQMCLTLPRLPSPSASHWHTPRHTCPRNRPEHMRCWCALRKINIRLSLQSHIETWRKGLLPLPGYSSHTDLLVKDKQDDPQLSSPEDPSPAVQGKEQELLQKAGIAQGCSIMSLLRSPICSHLFCTTGQVERVKSIVPKNHLLHQSLCTTVGKEWSMWSTNLFSKVQRGVQQQQCWHLHHD